MAPRKRSTAAPDASVARSPAPTPPSAQEAALAERTASNKKLFLDAYARTGNVSAAAVHAAVGRRTHYDWLKEDPEYAADFADAVDEAADRLEDEARRRATDGLIKYKFDKAGLPIVHPVDGGPYFEREYSDTLLIFLLKGARPEKYAERQKHAHTGKVTLEQVLDASRGDGASE
jgi:hypothetical protein